MDQLTPLTALIHGLASTTEWERSRPPVPCCRFMHGQSFSECVANFWQRDALRVKPSSSRYVYFCTQCWLVCFVQTNSRRLDNWPRQSDFNPTGFCQCWCPVDFCFVSRSVIPVWSNHCTRKLNSALADNPSRCHHSEHGVRLNVEFRNSWRI